MKSVKNGTVVLMVLTLLAAGCGPKEAKHAETALAPVQTRVVPVERLVVQRPIQVYGVVQPARQAFVSSRVVGPVVAVHVQAGDVVRKGQPLVSIEPQTIQGQVAQAKGALAQAEAALALAEKNFRRFEALYEQGAASDLELDMAKMQYEQAKGAVKQAEGAVQAAQSVADEAVVRAPFEARVVDRLVEVGDLAAPGRPLVRVESLAGRKIWLTVREADIGMVKEGGELSVRFDTRPDLGEVRGTADEIVPAADPATHTFTVKVALHGVEIPSGISGRATIPGETLEQLVVPASAVHRRGGLELVVVRGSDGLARTRAVTTGARLSDGRVEILSGLAEGEQVAVDLPGPVADGTPLEVRS